MFRNAFRLEEIRQIERYLATTHFARAIFIQFSSIIIDVTVIDMVENRVRLGLNEARNSY